MKHATPRTSQQPITNAHACVARYTEVVRGLNQRPSRKRRARSLPARRGRATITAAAAIPAPATTASAARVLSQVLIDELAERQGTPAAALTAHPLQRPLERLTCVPLGRETTPLHTV